MASDNGCLGRAVKLHKLGRDFSFTQKGLSVWTAEGRIKDIPFEGASKLNEYLEHWTMGDVRLCVRKGKVYLAISFKPLVEKMSLPNDIVVGVDRGIHVTATATNEKQQVFFGGGHLNHVRNRCARTRSPLQREKIRTDSRSIRRILKRLSGQEMRFQKDVDHVISLNIVEFARKTGHPTIAIEILGGIRQGCRLHKQQRTDFNQWAFYQLEPFIRDKAENDSVEVISVDPGRTSQGRSHCGHTEKANHHKHRFVYKARGYELHADSNASRNIQMRGILARQALSLDGALSIVPKARVVDSGLTQTRLRASCLL